MEPIALVIPCYNHANVLRRTLEGVLRQTVQPRTVVIVNDGSTDRPEQVIREFQAMNPLFEFTSIEFETNRGAQAARNAGAAATTEPLLLFLDADAELVPDALETFARTLDAHPEAGFAYANFRWGSRLFRGRPFCADALKRGNYIHTSSLVRRAVFPGFDERIRRFQDWDLWLTLAMRGVQGAWIDRELYRIVPRRDGISHWVPRCMYKIPWHWLGYTPEVIRRYHDAERVIRQKHGV